MLDPISLEDAPGADEIEDLIEEAERWDVEPKPASLWWTSPHADKMMDDIQIRRLTGPHKLLFEKKLNILEHIFVIKPEGPRTAWRKGCRVRARAGREM